MENFPGVGTENEMYSWAEFKPGVLLEEGRREPYHPQLGGLQTGLCPQMTWTPNEAVGRWAPNEPSEQHWAMPGQDYQNTTLSPHWQQRNTPLRENLLWEGVSALQTMGTDDTGWWSGGQNVSRTLLGFNRNTLGPQRSSISGVEPGSILEEGSRSTGSSISGFPSINHESFIFPGGVGLVSEAEALQPGEFEESNPTRALGGGEEGMNFQGCESQEACESWQRPEYWLQFDPMRRDFLFGNQVLTEAIFSGREMVGTDCEENFSQRSDLPKSQPAESKKKTYRCSKCGESFPSKYELIRHEHSHAAQKPYPCSVCEESFSQSTYRDNHERAYTKAKPYICSVCGKGFLERKNLVFHQNIHTRERPYHCMECDKSYSWNSQLIAHSAKHKSAPFKCLECGRIYFWKCSLDKHMKSHNKKKPQTSAHCKES